MLSRHMKQYSLLILVLLLGLRTAEACSCGSSGTVLDAYNHKNEEDENDDRAKTDA